MKSRATVFALVLHKVLMPSGTRLPDQMLDPSSHLHLSFELSHGWTDTFETGVFVETSPSAGDRHATFTGFHVRPKLRLAKWQRVPFHVSLSAEYAFVKQPGDTDFRQALAITPILERHVRGMEVSFNPAIEIGLRGPEAGEAPIFEPSAKVAEQHHLNCSGARPPDGRRLGPQHRRRPRFDGRQRALGGQVDRRPPASAIIGAS